MKLTVSEAVSLSDQGRRPLSSLLHHFLPFHACRLALLASVFFTGKREEGREGGREEEENARGGFSVKNSGGSLTWLELRVAVLRNMAKNPKRLL